MQTVTLSISLLLIHLVGCRHLPTTTCTQPKTHCGDNLCCCHKEKASCSRLGNNLTYIPELPETITNLEFTFNKLTHLSKSSLKNASKLSLTRFAVSNNQIERLTEDTFDDFRILTRLDLSNNVKISKTDLSLALGGLPKGIELRLMLENISLSSIPETFFKPMNGSKIQTLVMNRNMLKSVDMKAFRYLPRLKKLDLSMNHIQNFDASFGHVRLGTLILTHNEIARHVPVFCNKTGPGYPYPYLSMLYLKENFISTLLSAQWNCLKYLDTLDLGKNVFRAIPDNAFSHLTKLRVLRVDQMIHSNMKLDRLAFNSSSLRNLTLETNNIAFRSRDVVNNYFKHCPNLVELRISMNNFKRLDDDNVTSLLAPLTHLKALFMVSCHLRAIPPKLFIYIPHLRFLSLDGNSVTTIDGTFYGAQMLEHLTVQANKLRIIGPTAFPVNVRKILKRISLADNPFDCTCSMLWFRSVINNRGVMVGTNLTLDNWPKRYKCHFPSDKNGLFLIHYNPTEKSCRKSHLILIISSTLGSVLFLLLVLTPIIYRYRWYLSYWMYRRKQTPENPEARPLLQDHAPYAYVIYNDEDRQFVHQDFRRLVEDEYGFKLYIWHRDADVGNAKAYTMFDGIHGSNHVIAIVSKHFMADNWCEFQLDVATHQQIELRKDFVTLVILEDIHKALLRKSWCVVLSRLETVSWCSDAQDVRRKVFEQQIRKRVSKTIRDK